MKKFLKFVQKKLEGLVYFILDSMFMYKNFFVRHGKSSALWDIFFFFFYTIYVSGFVVEHHHINLSLVFNPLFNSSMYFQVLRLSVRLQQPFSD